ncbi:MAG: carbohydrate ABC transporter permease [Candidatus Merdivicinus sp.]
MIVVQQTQNINTKKSFQKKIYPYLFILPFALLTITFFVLPAIATVWMSFTDLDVKMKPNFIGFQNYIRIFNDYSLGEILGNTIIYAVCSLGFVLLLSLVIAISTQYFMKGKAVATGYRILWLIPSLFPSVVFAIFWKYIFDPTENGFLNQIVLNMGMADEPVSWITRYAMPIVILGTVVGSVSGNVILLSSSINSIPEDLYKAARVDGAGEKSIILKIILPTLRWPLMYITITTLISLVSSYFFIMLLTDGGPMHDSTTLALYSYQQAFQLKYYGYGAAISMFVVAIALALTLILLRLFDFDTLVRPSRIEE